MYTKLLTYDTVWCIIVNVNKERELQKSSSKVNEND